VHSSSSAQIIHLPARWSGVELKRPLDPRQAQIVEMRFLRGLSIEKTSNDIGVSLATVKKRLDHRLQVAVRWNPTQGWLK
jgi:DNA invertase Pin-like site-specific DNA recombinase